MICKKCGKEYLEDYRRDAATRKTPSRFCSRACASSRAFTAASRALKSQKNKEAWNAKARQKVATYCCEVCGAEFHSCKAPSASRKTCSDECKRFLQSVKRSSFLARNGTIWKTERRLFEYKHTRLECDSALEEAGVIFLIDFLGAIRIERYRNLVNYFDSGLHKVFNPDFWVTFKDNQQGIVEVKMKWSAASDHSYNKPIPLKKAALQAFCEDKKLKFIWLDFDYDDRFSKVYEDHLKKGTGRQHFMRRAGVSPHSDKV